MKPLLYFLLVLSLLGAADAGYLVIQSVSGQAVFCPSISVGGLSSADCNIVLATSYAKVFGLPVAVYGLAAYLLFAVLVLYELKVRFTLQTFSEKKFGGRAATMKLLAAFSGFGVLVSAYFTYLQFFVINALCFYCLVSSGLITLIFIGTVVYNFRYSAKAIT